MSHLGLCPTQVHEELYRALSHQDDISTDISDKKREQYLRRNFRNGMYFVSSLLVFKLEYNVNGEQYLAAA